MPPNSRSHRASSAPLVLSNEGHGHSDRLHIESGELCAGCIVWLPHKVLSAGSIRCSKANCCGKELDDAGYEHPVVVLSIKHREGSYILGDLICTVATVSIVGILNSLQADIWKVTTFDNTSLQKYLEKRRRSKYHQESIPIRDPAGALLETEIIESTEYLNIENGSLYKQSYVKLQHTYEIPSSTLCQYNYRARRAYSLRLQHSSYELLMTKLDLEAQTFLATSQIQSTRESRLNLLAGIPAIPLAQTTPSPSAFPALPPSPTPHRLALQYGTVPSAWTQPLPTRVQPVRSPTAPNPAKHLPLPNYNATSPPNNLYSQSTYHGIISSSVPTYQPTIQARRYTPPELAPRPAYHEDSGDGSGSTFITLVVVVVVGALLYWKFW